MKLGHFARLTIRYIIFIPKTSVLSGTLISVVLFIGLCSFTKTCFLSQAKMLYALECQVALTHLTLLVHFLRLVWTTNNNLCELIQV